MPLDPRHGRFVPTGRDLARVLRAVFRRIGETVASALRNERNVRLDGWIQILAEAAYPLMERYYVQGGRATFRNLRRVRAAKAAGAIQGKGILEDFAGLSDGEPSLTDSAFDVLLPQVRLQVQALTLRFVQETLATAATDANAAYQELRTELKAGLDRGEALKKITERVQRIFNDPMRAQRIAMTEASRSMHAGQMQAARESGIVKGLKWLASSDACERCLALDGKEVALGEPFAIDPRGGPYAVTYHPPGHPHCMCAVEEVID